MQYRIYVEKKEGFNVESLNITREIREQLSIDNLSIRIVNRYDVLIEDEIDIKTVYDGILSEINQDDITEELELNLDDKVFAVEYQPGQYDVRCDSAVQCIKLLYPLSSPSVKYAKMYIVSGEVHDDDIVAIQKYVINPVDSHLASLGAASFEKREVKPEINVILENFTSYNQEELEAFRLEQGLAMDNADLKMIYTYFKDEEKRNPTLTEMKVLDTYWSDHCRHSTFGTHLENITFGAGDINDEIKSTYNKYLDVKKELGRQDRPTTLMDIATIATRYNKSKGFSTSVEESDEINACSYNIDVKTDKGNREYLLMFKNETHNHPTEIEPFGGAATCLGGAIRDPLSGRAYVYQSMRVTGSANPCQKLEDTISGKLPQRKITTEAAEGFSSYGNQIGLCTGQVKEYYHKGFTAKRMEVGAVIAAAPKENVVREKPDCGDLIYVIGGRTGRDGIGGASGSSKEHNVRSVDTAASEVQKGNAPQERKLQRLFRNKECANLIKKCNDFGAGGVCVAIGELADSLEIALDTLLLKYDGLSATELSISESQERMAVVISPKDEKRFIELVESENLEYSKTAVVTDDGRLIMKYGDVEVLNLSRAFIETNGASRANDVYVDANNKFTSFTGAEDFTSSMKKLVGGLNVCSQKGLVEHFDNTIGATNVVMPYGGRYMLTPSDVMVSKIPVLDAECETVSVMAHGYDPYLSSENTYLGGLYSIVSLVSKMVASGIDYKDIMLSCQEYFEKLKNDKQKWGKVFSALLGALKVQLELSISAIGGKDSMSGTYENISVPPTLIGFGVAVCDAESVVTNEFKKAGSKVVLIKNKVDKNGVIDFEVYKKNLLALNKMIKDKKVLSAKALGYGGIAESVFKMAIGNMIGFEFSSDFKDNLFSKAYADILIEVENLSDVVGFEEGSTLLLGQTIMAKELVYNNEKIELDILVKENEMPLENVFPISVDEKIEVEKIDYKAKEIYIAANKFATPKVFIPVFPGTNCEYDTVRAFENAGAECECFVLKNNSAKDIIESAKIMAEKISNAQIMALAGGFSAADEPEGSGKFIVSALKNPFVFGAVEELLYKRDGLMLGICNGFQALVKTGLLPYGELGKVEKNSPTLTFNSIGRHIAKIVYTKITSNASAWLNLAEVGEVHAVAMSHGEGRFIADSTHLKKLIDNNQVVAQYCTIDGEVIGDGKVNPNGSTCNIEAITSPDGRILGKMGHSERVGSHLYKNIEGNFDQKIFSSGVKYFK